MAPPPPLPRRSSDVEDNFAMDGAGSDDYAWGSNGIDLNSQAQGADDFPGLDLYGNILQGDADEVLPAGVRGSGHHPYRPPHAGAGDARATAPAPYARQLLFGGSSSAAAGRGGGNNGVFPGGSSSGAGGPVRQRANSATATGRRPQRSNLASRTNSGQRTPRPQAPRAPITNAVRGQPMNTSGAPFDNNDAAMEDDVEELASFGGPPVSQGKRAQWNDKNNASLLQLCIEQRIAGNYNGSQMNREGYLAVVDGFLVRRKLVYTRGQIKNQIGVLKNIHAFWRYLQVHTGLGRRPDGSIDADHEFWETHTEKKPYLKKLLTGPPGNEDLLDELFRGYTVDGNTAFVPGDDYGDFDGQYAGSEDEEEGFQPTPTSRSSQRSQKGKRALNSTTSTVTSPVKKSKSPMVRIVKDMASTFKESVAANAKQIEKRVNDKAAFSVKKCQELAYEAGIEKTVDNIYAMSKFFSTAYQREFFCGELTPGLRLGYFKKWCRDNNME